MKTINQKIATVEDQLSRFRQKQRTQQTRKKIIAGALVLSAIDNDSEKREWFLGLLQSVTREADKRIVADMIEEQKVGQGG